MTAARMSPLARTAPTWTRVRTAVAVLGVALAARYDARIAAHTIDSTGHGGLRIVREPFTGRSPDSADGERR